MDASLSYNSLSLSRIWLLHNNILTIEASHLQNKLENFDKNMTNMVESPKILRTTCMHEEDHMHEVEISMLE
jgi:hypothetical protein